MKEDKIIINFIECWFSDYNDSTENSMSRTSANYSRSTERKKEAVSSRLRHSFLNTKFKYMDFICEPKDTIPKKKNSEGKLNFNDYCE